MCALPRFLTFMFTAAVLCFASAGRAQTFQYMLEPGSTITPSYYGSPIGATELLTGTFSWTYVGYDAYWSTVNFSTTALSFHSPSYSLSLLSSPYNGGTRTAGPWAAFHPTLTAIRAPFFSPLSFFSWPPNDGTFCGEPLLPSPPIFFF